MIRTNVDCGAINILGVSLMNTCLQQVARDNRRTALRVLKYRWREDQRPTSPFGRITADTVSRLNVTAGTMAAL